MTYPNQYPPQPTQQPQPGYFQGQQPAAYPPPTQGYPPQQQQAYYPPPQQQFAPPPAQHLNASIDDFYDQPAASGKSIASWFQTPGQSITGMVARPISKADLRPQTDMQSKQPKYFSDGRPMITMTIPLQVQPQPDFPDGRAAWIISSSDREDLDVAMQAAGCAPRTVPEAGALITITFVGFKQIPGFGAPKKVKQIQYTRPQGAVPFANSATAPAPGAAAPTSAAPATASYADPQGEAAADMVNGNGNVPNGQYAPPPQMVPQEQVAHYGQPQAGYVPPPAQPQQPWPGPQAQQAAMQGMQNYQPQAPPQNGVPFNGGQAQGPPQGSPPEQQWAAPSELTAEQQERLRQLTGN